MTTEVKGAAAISVLVVPAPETAVAGGAPALATADWRLPAGELLPVDELWPRCGADFLSLARLCALDSGLIMMNPVYRMGHPLRRVRHGTPNESRLKSPCGAAAVAE